MFSDHLGSTSVTRDQAGANNTQRHTPWGETRIDGNLTTDHTFTGQINDTSTGLGFYNARYQDPITGRFVSPDTTIPSAGNGQDYNRYSYVRNQPTVFTDPTGQCVSGQEHLQQCQGTLDGTLLSTCTLGGEGYNSFCRLASGGQIIGYTGTIENNASDVGDITHVFGRCNAPGTSHSECFEYDQGLLLGVVAGLACGAAAGAAGFTAGASGALAAVSCGAFGGIVGQAGANLQHGDPILNGTGRAALIGAGTGLLFYGGGAVISRVAGRIVVRPTGAPCRSFSADTEVLLGDGQTTKPISEIEVGDRVWAHDPQTGQSGSRQVLVVWPHYDWLLDLNLDGGSVTTTEDHYFWSESDQQWQQSQRLDRTDHLLSASGRSVDVVGLDWSSTQFAEAFDLTVEELHTYFVEVGDETVLVHNTGCLGDDWVQRAADTIKVSSDCRQCADDIVSRLGGGEKVWVRPTTTEYLPQYRGADSAWIKHQVVVKDGRVYDAFGGPDGIAVSEWKRLWDGFDEGLIDFGGM